MKRIQRRREAGWRLPKNTVCVTRPGAFGNPFIGGGAVYWFRTWLNSYPHLNVIEMDRILEQASADHPLAITVGNYDLETTGAALVKLARGRLSGKDLACWCPLEKPCHADVYLELLRS